MCFNCTSFCSMRKKCVKWGIWNSVIQFHYSFFPSEQGIRDQKQEKTQATHKQKELIHRDY